MKVDQICNEICIQVHFKLPLQLQEPEARLAFTQHL